MRDINFI